jgi:predicted small secreted protein
MVFLRESRKMVRKILLVLALVVVVVSLLGCKTIQRLGEDIKWVGEKASELVE